MVTELNHCLDSVRDKAGLSPVHAVVMHAYALDEAERLKERVSSEFNCAELWITEFSPVMSYACALEHWALLFMQKVKGGV